MDLKRETLSFLFLAIFLFSHQIQGRDSQFFSKVTNDNNPKETTTNTAVIPKNDNNNNNFDQKQVEQDPTFNNAKFYDNNESETENENYNKNNYYYNSENGVKYNNNNNNKYYNKRNTNNVGNERSYNPERQGMSDTRFLENGKYFYDVNSEKNYDPNSYRESKVAKTP